MKNIIPKLFATPSVTLLITLFSALLYINVASAQNIDTQNELTDEDAQAIFDLAMNERDTGKVYDSIQKFEYILSRRPSLNRARLELAVSYHRASQYDKALHEFHTVLDNPDTPEEVRLSILAYMGQVMSDENKPQYEQSFSYYTKVGALYNSNLNFAPLSGNQGITTDAGKKVESPGMDTFLSASHRYQNNKPFDIDGAATLFEWQSQISWTGNNYTDSSDFNFNVLSASTGPAFISTGRWRGAVNLQLDQTYYGNSTLGTFLSLNPLLTFDLGNYRTASLEMSLTNNNFTRSEDQDRDGNSILVGAAYSTLLDDANNGIEVGFRLTDQYADDDQFGYRAAAIYFGGFLTFATNNNVYLNINLKQYDYKAADTLACSPAPCSTDKRNETEGTYEVGYNMDIKQGFLQNWTLNTHVTYIRNNSNVDFYSYDRTIFAINLARYFI
ncbi:MAG: hypothetical protein RQ982_08175 [Gammaproteobacteria bacterium]|nr:hypothetical protein [Gammaproteobacteria bacterium]